MSSRSLTIEQVLALLAETLQRIATLTNGLAPAQLRTAPGQGEWSANDVLAHMRSCADMWGKCIATMLAEDRPTIRAVHPRTWIKQTDYPDLEFGPSVRSFATQRADLLAILEPLPPEAWARAAAVKETGGTLERTVLSYAERLARHEQPHIEQIGRIVGAMRS